MKSLVSVLALICWAMLGSAQSVNAEGVNSAKLSLPNQQYSNDEALSALNAFAQQIGVEEPKLASAKTSDNPHSQLNDEAFAALRDFAQRIGAGQPEPVQAAQPKFAEANTAFDALRGFLQNSQQQPQPAASETAKAARAAAPKRVAVDAAATYVGEKVCKTCHASHAESFGKTLMGRIGKTQPGKFACENCHGPGSAHAKAGGGRGVGGIISFRPEDDSRTAEENNGICLGCHEKGDRTYWNGSTHETRGLMCTNCHTIMKNVSAKKQLKTVAQMDTCFQCHKDRRAQMFRSSHMPLREGKMVCSDCHNPHGSATEGLLKEASINDTCYKCHAEKRGPFLFEHPPVRENCLNCHDPHGSVNEYLLKVSRPRLCAECHGFGHGVNSGSLAVQTLGRSCQNCHTKVHGSNSPSGSLFHR